MQTKKPKDGRERIVTAPAPFGGAQRQNPLPRRFLSPSFIQTYHLAQKTGFSKKPVFSNRELLSAPESHWIVQTEVRSRARLALMRMVATYRRSGFSPCPEGQSIQLKKL